MNARTDLQRSDDAALDAALRQAEAVLDRDRTHRALRRLVAFCGAFRSQMMADFRHAPTARTLSCTFPTMTPGRCIGVFDLRADAPAPSDRGETSPPLQGAARLPPTKT